MYIDSYNASYGKEKLFYKCDEVGYTYSSKNNIEFSVWTDWYSISTFRNGMYSNKKIRIECWWWLASPSGREPAYMCNISAIGFSLGNSYPDSNYGVSPVVSLKHGVQLQIQAE